MKTIATICCIIVIANILSAVELPPPFISYETTSTGEAGVNSTAYTWNVRENGISGGIYAGRTLLSSLRSSASFRFDGVSGTLKFKCTNYAGGMGCLDPSWSCGWFTDDELINNRSGVIGVSRISLISFRGNCSCRSSRMLWSRSRAASSYSR